METKLFDTSNLGKHEALFRKSSKPWEWLKNLQRYLAELPREDIKSFPPDKPYTQQYNAILMNNVNGPVLIHKDANIEKHAYLEGPVFIGPGCTIEPFASVRRSLVLNGCLIGQGSQIRRSILLPGVQAMHANYVSDSVIGRNVVLRSGAKIDSPKQSEPVRLHWGKTLVDTGLLEFGALIGDGVTIDCNTVIAPGTILSKTPVIQNN